MKTIIKITQSIEQLAGKSKKSFFLTNKDHMFKSNNWLKYHHKPKRRKPYKRQYIIIDEASCTMVNYPDEKLWPYRSRVDEN